MRQHSYDDEVRWCKPEVYGSKQYKDAKLVHNSWVVLYVHGDISFQELDLSNLRLTSIHHRAFCNTYGIWTLDISRNNLTQLPYLCTLLEKIGRLYAQYNKIYSISFGYFNDFVDLRALSLSANYLGLGVEPDFSPLANTLREIRLSNNPWENVPVSLYNTTYRMLRGIFLARSQIAEIPAEAIRAWPIIIALHIESNLIRCLNDLRNTTKRTGIRVYARNNPWHCGSCMVSD